MISSKQHTHCRACDMVLPLPFLDLGMQPLANNLCRENEHCDDVFPMRLCRCNVCGLLQLDEVVDPTALFSHYLYTPSQSKKTLAHFQELADTATKKIQGDGFVVDVGSNDGALLGMFAKHGWAVCGVDPARNLAQEANDKGLLTVVGFFDDDNTDLILRNHNKADLITANNVFAHSPDWDGFARCAAKLLATKGKIAIEFPYGPIMLRDGTFDLIYFEHCSYPSLKPISLFFSRYGLHVQDVERLPDVHGGSIRVWIGFDATKTQAVEDMIIEEETTNSPDAAQRFLARVEETKRQLSDTVAQERAAGRRLVGFTAPAKCVTLLVAAGITDKDIDFIMDDNPLKQERMLPKLHIPIYKPVTPLNGNTTVIIFAWNVYEDIMTKVPYNDVIIPMPMVHVIRR